MRKHFVPLAQAIITSHFLLSLRFILNAPSMSSKQAVIATYEKCFAVSPEQQHEQQEQQLTNSWTAMLATKITSWEVGGRIA